jgi:hypothetical protein
MEDYELTAPTLPFPKFDRPERLDDANIAFGKELVYTKHCLDIYKGIGLNASKLSGPGKKYLGFAQSMALRLVIIGVDKLFDRVGDGEGKCSIAGLYRLAKDYPLKHPAAVSEFGSKYGVTPTASWQNDIDNIRKQQMDFVKTCMAPISRLRNDKLAHILQVENQESISYAQPSIDEFDKMLDYAYDWHKFIHHGFVGGCAIVLTEQQEYGASLFSMMEKLGISNVQTTFPDGRL